MERARKKRFWMWTNIIATLSTITLALTALITVYLTMAAWRVQQEAARPYFILQESPKVDVEKTLSFELKFTNVGMHPAVDLSSKTIVFAEQLTGSPLHYDASAIVNEIPKDASSSLVMIVPEEEIYRQQEDINAHYLVVDIHYKDPILNKSYSQLMYWKWNGVSEDALQPTVHVRAEEKEKIMAYLQTNGIEVD